MPVLGMFGLAPVLASAEAAPDSATSIYFPIHSRPLGEVVKDFASRSGIKFRLADGLGQDKVTATLSASTWQEAAKALLQGYNYAVEAGQGGAWETVTVTGKNGDGQDGPRSTASAGHSRLKPQELPVRFQGYQPDSVFPINLPLLTLKKMKPGQKVSLDLPDGPRNFVHDNRFSHDNGDSTWVGYAEEDGPPYRAMLTLAKSGVMGHILTPDGMYEIVTEGGQTYWIDLKASGLQAGSLLADQATPHARPGGTEASGEAGAMATIDLLVLHPKGLEQAETRVNYLTALTNQAFLDSKVNAQIRVVHRQVVDYAEAGDNQQALSELTDAKPPFDKVPAWREQYRADLVTLIRPFHASSQKSCGVAWVNGQGGSGLSADSAYSVVGDGDDQDGALLYCGGQTLAHELGHNLGNVHDRPLSQFPGAFPYSYAWGVEGSFGTIMSYRQPAVLLFATPLLAGACRGQACGHAEGEPDAADNARTINQTAPVVAGFQPAAPGGESP